ncbi:MAG: T9SS type A sorting domain-containing protein [Cytophagales bacterium]|nr:T9SS type A sorting domain-containing protein [Cytophagales bacterium]
MIVDQIILVNTNDLQLKDVISIFPNPTSDVVNITIENANEGTVRVSTSQGTLVQEETITNGETSFEINGGTGLYLIEVQTAEKTATFKVIKN